MKVRRDAIEGRYAAHVEALVRATPTRVLWA